jgi:CheY-like chemotaxis protein
MGRRRPGEPKDMLQKSLPAEAAEVQLGQAQRMEIVGQLTGGVVHDFNNILTVISGTIEILAEAVADREDLAAIAGLIAEAAARGANLTSTLLAFSRGQPSQPRDVDVNALLADAARLLRPTLGEHIEIDALRATDVSLVLVDPNLLMTAILNLAVVARDAMPEGGKLTFETRNAISGEGCASAEDEISVANHVMVAVNASGYAGHSDRAVVDIGIISGFIKQSNGHINVRKEAGRGTSVKMYLPRASGFVQPLAEDPSEGGNESILIVEDDELVRNYIVTQVQSLGYRALAAGNASEALTIIDKGEKIDLLFTDVAMPGSINGWQLAVEALHRRPALKVLYTSGYAKIDMPRDERLDTDVLLLAKPYRKIDLAKMIRTALAA